MTDPNTAISKFLSYVLRHHPESIGIQLDSQGWANIDTLLAQAQQHNRTISREQLLKVVATNPKKRFTLSDDQTQIRAAQGHSTAQVAIAHNPIQPPDTLYHGTATMCTSPPTSPPRKKSDNATANPSCCASTPPPCTPQGIRSI